MGFGRECCVFVRLGKWEDAREKTKDSCRSRPHARRALSCAVWLRWTGSIGGRHWKEADGECVVFARGRRVEKD